MTQPEFLAWIEFYKQQPFDDYSRHYRPAALISHMVDKTHDLDGLLGWLERRPDPLAEFSDADLATMKAFGMKPPRKTA